MQMIDDEANFDNILDASEEGHTAAKFYPKQRAKPRKTLQASRSAAPNPTIETGDGKLGILNQVNSSKERPSHERASLTYTGSETVDDITGSQGILDKPLEDALPGDTSASDTISQDDKHNAASSKLDIHQETLVISDIHMSPSSSCGKTIDDIVEFGEMVGAQAKEERVAKFQPKVQVKLAKAAKSQKINQKVEASAVAVATQNEMDDDIQTRFHYDQQQDPKCHGSVQTPDSEGLLAADSNDVGSLASLDSVLEESDQEETIAKFHPKLRLKAGMVSSKVVRTNDNITVATPMVRVCAENTDILTKPKDKETVTSPCTSPQDVHATVDFDNNNELINSPLDGTQLMAGEASAEATCKPQPNVGTEKCKGKSVTFALSDASGVMTPTDTNYETRKSSEPDGNLSNLYQQTAEKEYNDNESLYREGTPSEHAIEQPTKSGVRSSMKLRCRKRSNKAETSKNKDDYVDEDCVEPSLGEEDNNIGDDYTAGTKRKVRKKSRVGVEESKQEKVQKDKSQVSSRGRKRTSKDALAEKPEKKLTHRIRQTRAKEVKTLLETHPDDINPMELSAAHLRLLQEARERVNAKENPSGPSSNTSSFQLNDMDDLDYRDEEARNFDNERIENHVQNVTKLNYHSYMNKQSRGKWSKSDTDMFYKVIKQLNIEDVAVQEVNNTHKEDGTSSEQGPKKENALDDFIQEEEYDSNWLDEEHGVQKPDVQEELASGNHDDDDLGDVFDWY
ncbi:hypothetical protein HU200_057037 [Digitaria exilis]|uniref:Uncharacterized protein n=1 Tax=Digitaria exilis TaxID=1010633 RepID=A0A835E1U0_9POAL|nr:hypothetical protein HU200_057037 [Digitaria exilis]